MPQQILFSEEKKAPASNGLVFLFLISFLCLIALISIIVGPVLMSDGDDVIFAIGIFLISLGLIGCCIFPFLFVGLKLLNPGEALVLTFLGKYYGTLNEPGFYWVNPFCSAVNPAFNAIRSGQTTAIVGMTNCGKKISLKENTLNNDNQKVNDELGNPVEIGAIVIWKVVNAAKAVFHVDNYQVYLSTQCDAVIRNVVRCYPYDNSTDGDEENDKDTNAITLRGSSQEIADLMKKELQEKVDTAGIDIMEVRITHLAYAPEIAAAMLQRQQAVAVIAARREIVEGAVGMVSMAVDKLEKKGLRILDEKQKAEMVSNLLVVLCGNKEAQPVISCGSN